MQNITRYVTVALALIEGIAMTVGFGNQGLLENATWYNMAVVVVALTAGSAFLMWVGERITPERCRKRYLYRPPDQHRFPYAR